MKAGVFAFFDAHPALAGIIRGFLQAILLGAISAGINYFSDAGNIPAPYAAYASILVILLRSLEGMVDSINKKK